MCRRLLLEQLEARELPASYTAASVSDLIADVNAANLAGGSNTITLVAGTTFTLTAATNNYVTGADGLPAIAANDNLTIIGNGDTIERSTATGTPVFRLLEVAPGGTLALADLTLQGGLLSADGTAASGGAILNQGTLTLDGVTVQNNTAQDRSGWGAYGGGIYSSGALTVTSCTIQNNNALGGGYQPIGNGYVVGGTAWGGGIYVAGGTADLSSVTLSGNTAQGGNGNDGRRYRDPFVRNGWYVDPPGYGGSGLGGGMYVAGGIVTLRLTTVSGNTAQAGKAGKPINGLYAKDGVGFGGGLCLRAGASVGLDAFTQAQVTNNHASTSYPNIDGSFTTLT